ARARQGLRVRGRHLRRRASAQLHPGGREGHPAGRPPRAPTPPPARRLGQCFLAGPRMGVFPVVLYDGQYHDVDSSELAFKLAGALAYKEAMAQAKPTLLQPIMNVEVDAPNEYVGDLMGDLSSRRGHVQGMDTAADDTIIRAQAPMGEMLTYG